MALLAFCTGGLTIGKFELDLGTDALRTLTFVILVFGSQATLYAIRHPRRMWGTRPSLWRVLSSATDVLIASMLAIGGIAMTPLPAVTVAAAVAFAFALDAVKIPVFAHLRIT